MATVILTLAVIFLAAFLVESLGEYLFGQPFNIIQKLKPYKWLLMYLVAGVGVGLAFVYEFDIMYLLGELMADLLGIENHILITPYGKIMTGAAIGRGANYLHDVVSKYFKKPQI